jgi:hypothetical protein
LAKRLFFSNGVLFFSGLQAFFLLDLANSIIRTSTCSLLPYVLRVRARRREE